jgi:hypothetical protein
MNVLRNNPNITRTSAVLLVGALGAVGCSSSKEATIVETEITPMTAVYEWPLVEVEDKPSSGFVLVDTIDDSYYSCPSVDDDGNPECSWEYDEDYIGYRRYLIPIDSESSASLRLEGREFAGNLETPPTMDSPRNTANTMYSVESYYDISVDFTIGDSEDIKSCSGGLNSATHNQETIRRGLTGVVSYNDSWGNKSIQFKKDDDIVLRINC